MNETDPTSPATPPHLTRAFHPFSSQVRVDIAGVTHAGLLRENNEDQFYVAKMSRALETLTTSLPPDSVPQRAEEVNYAMVVADGMGGHAAGEVASRLAISALVGLVLELPNWILRLDEVANARASALDLYSSLRDGYRQLRRNLIANGEVSDEVPDDLYELEEDPAE